MSKADFFGGNWWRVRELFRGALSGFLTIFMMNTTFSGAAEPSPTTEKKPVNDVYHGVKVTDEYRWLEESGAARVKEWTRGQSEFARRYFDRLEDRVKIESQLTALYAEDPPSYGGLVARPGRLFALKFQPPKQQRLLVSFRSFGDLRSEKVVLDPNEIAPKGQVSMDWFVPSPDGSILAVCLSEHGSEEGTLFFYRTETGGILPDRIPRVQYPTGGGSAAWTADGAGIFYTRYPHPGEKAAEDVHFFQEIYFHKIGRPVSEDSYAAGRDFPRIAETDLSTSPCGRWVLARVANGDGGEYAHYLHDLQGSDRGKWREISHWVDGVKEVDFNRAGTAIYLRSVKGSPHGKILRLGLGGEAKLSEAKTIVPEGEAVIEGITITPSFLFVVDLVGGPSRVRRFDLDGGNLREVPLLAAAGVGQLFGLTERAGDERILFRETSYVAPSAWYVYDPQADGGKGLAEKIGLSQRSPVDFRDIECVREFAVSADGSKVPMNILRRKGMVLDGSNPLILSGYGGYGISLRPGFDFTQRLWFDRGGVVVVANLRGGGEYGEEWHLAGNLTRKQNVFDDFAACARTLIARGYTRPEKLAIEGGSNGGLLMGALLTQHPELVRAVVSHVGIYDMLRVELDPNGAFNITEFGTVKDQKQFEAIYAYSPYHRVVDGTKYPAVFFLAGENDGRVNPANSRKMAARLQSASGSGRPILARFSAASGHGMGTALSERIAQKADVLAFLFDQLGMPRPGATEAKLPR